MSFSLEKIKREALKVRDSETKKAKLLNYCNSKKMSVDDYVELLNLLSDRIQDVELDTLRSIFEVCDLDVSLLDNVENVREDKLDVNKEFEKLEKEKKEIEEKRVAEEKRRIEEKIRHEIENKTKRESENSMEAMDNKNSRKSERIDEMNNSMNEPKTLKVANELEREDKANELNKLRKEIVRIKNEMLTLTSCLYGIEKIIDGIESKS